MTVNIDEDIKKKIVMIADQSRLTESEVIKLAVERFVFNFDIDRIRNKLREKAIKKGFTSEDDILNKIS